jgi:superfamily II DNA or RNA helicase
MIQLYDDQMAVIADLRKALRIHQSVILRASCRFGKTVVAAYMAQGIVNAGQSVIFGVHRRELARQVSNTYTKFNIPHSYIMGGEDTTDSLAYVATAGALMRRPEMLKVNWFIVDEGHIWSNGEMAKLIDTAKEYGAKIIILTATPARGDGKPLKRIADAIVHGPTERSLIEAGRLAKYLPVAPVRPDLSRLSVVGGEYSKKEIDAMMDGRFVVKDAIKYWRQFADGKRTIGFAPSRKRGAEYADEFTSAGIPARFIDGETKDKERLQAINDFADGKIQVLFNCQLAREGWDLSSQVGRDVPIQAVLLMNPSKSLPMAIQMLMRPMTSQDGTAVILDMAGIMVNHDGTLNHGFPDSEREWSLEGSVAFKKSERVIPTCTCGECFGVFRYRPSCPYCGGVKDVKGRSLPEIALEMEAIDPGAIRAREEIERKAARMKQGRAQTIQDLADIAASKNYEVGWLFKMAKIKKVSQPYNVCVRELAEAKRRMAI